MKRPIKFLLILGMCFACTSCWFRKQSVDLENNEPLTADEFRKQVMVLEKEVEQLRSQLAGSGRGAYARGPRHITGQAGDETLLDRLYNAETALESTQEELDQRTASISKLKQNVINNAALIRSLELKAELYEKNKDKIATLQDNRKLNLAEIQDLRANLVEAELQLLKLQSKHFNFAREILELEPGDTQSFLELQDKVKLMTIELKPKKTPTNSLSQVD